MNINNAKFCFHDGYITDEPECPICGSKNKLCELKRFLAGTSNIPNRLFEMNLLPSKNPHISNFKVCDYCFSVLKPRQKCNCEINILYKNKEKNL